MDKPLTKISYEWTIEEVVDGEVIDSDHSDKLEMVSPETFKQIGNGYDIGVVCDDNRDRVWAYIKDGELPKRFSNSLGEEYPNWEVPQRFHKELEAYKKRHNI